MEKLMFVLHMVGMALAIGSGFSVIALVFISGLVMLAQNGGAFIDAGGTFFRVKIVLFALYVLAFMILRRRVSKARLTNGGPLMIHMSKFVVTMNVLGVMTIVASVLSFHG